MKNLIYLTIALIFSSCYDSALDATDKNSDASLNYLDDSQDPGIYANDEYKIIGIIPVEDIWKVVVQYAGGCEDHDFLTWSDNSIYNNAIQFYLFHNSNGDMCEALIRDTVELEMTGIFDFDVSNLDITMINASNNRPIDLPLELRSMTQSDDCFYNASFVGTACGQGIWSNQWFSLEDSLSTGENVWFQPIRNSTEVDLEKPDPGKYTIGVTFLFGYQYAEDGIGTCQSIPSGAIIPVAINCLEEKK